MVTDAVSTAHANTAKTTKADPKQFACYVDGEFVHTNKTFPNRSPIHGRELGQVHEADEALVNRAVLAAERVVAGAWGQTTPEQRAALMHKIADGIERRFEDFVAAEVADTGRPEHQARSLDVYRGIANFRTFADLIRTAGGECYESFLANGDQLLNYTVRKPHGVVGIISPWNLPLLLLTWKVAPAMACGNAVVVKPSEETPSSATLLAEVMHEVGVPAGVFNLVHGFGPGSAGEFLSRHPNIDALTFTGESRTGSTIMQVVAPKVKEISFELGGKNAAVVFADANFDEAVRGVLRSAFTNSGQVCLCTERVYVERAIYPAFVEALKTATQALKIGYPHEDGVDMGSLISHQHRDKVLSYFKLAVDEGATVVTGGGVPRFGDERDEGAYVEPTIWTGLPDTARCVREEVFGPVCHIAPFDTEDEVIGRVNDSPYGLASCVWSQNPSRAHRMGKRLHVGIVWLNTWFSRDLRTPFGGAKLSGLGREGGRHSLDFYSEITNICVKV